MKSETDVSNQQSDNSAGVIRQILDDFCPTIGSDS